MLRILPHRNAQAAKGYYTGQAEAGYYAGARQEMVGSWGGQAAERLDLVGEVDRRSFELLCDNRHPRTGQRLTARQRQGRRIGYDFNFHACKSASLLFGLTGDPAILAAFRGAVAETMHDIEAQVRVRVRKRGQHGERIAGNALWSEYLHFTARPVKGVIDPHLHAHCFLLNACFDPVERVWKAIDVAGIKREGERYQKAFQARLSWKLLALGYPIERNGASWEIAGIGRATVEKFSGRTRQVESFAAQRGITDPKEKDGLGARTRERKRSEAGMEELRREWWARLSHGERAAIAAATLRRGPPAPASPPWDAWERERLAFAQRRQRRDTLPLVYSRPSSGGPLRQHGSHAR